MACEGYHKRLVSIDCSRIGRELECASELFECSPHKTTSEPAYMHQKNDVLTCRYSLWPPALHFQLVIACWVLEAIGSVAHTGMVWPCSYGGKVKHIPGFEAMCMAMWLQWKSQAQAWVWSNIVLLVTNCPICSKVPETLLCTLPNRSSISSII